MIIKSLVYLNFIMYNQTLMMPPHLNEGDEEQFSYNGSEAKLSAKSTGKQKKKQTSLSIKKKYPQNQSDVSASENRELETGSVASHGSRGSVKKGKKKETSLGKVKHHQVTNNFSGDIFQSFPEEKEKDPEVVQYSPVEKSQVKNFMNPNEEISPPERVKRERRKKIHSPFSEIIDDAEDQVPVVKIQQVPTVTKNEEYVSPKGIQKKDYFEKNTRTYEQEKKNKIFKNSTVQNESEINSISQMYDESKTLEGQSRRSKSRLGNLFRQSRQKTENQSRVNFHQSEISSVGELKQESKVNFKSKLGSSKEKMVYIQKKQLDENEDNFMKDFSKSDLNLSQSGNHSRPSNQKQPGKAQINSFNEKDSFCFNFEAEKKKKGVSIISRNKSPELLYVEGDVLISKRLDSKEKLKNNLKKNQEYLKNSGLIGEKKPVQKQKQQVKNMELQKQRMKEQENERIRQQKMRVERQRLRQIEMQREREMERQRQKQARQRQEKQRREKQRRQKQRRQRQKKQRQLLQKEQRQREEMERERERRKRQEMENLKRQKQRQQMERRQKQKHERQRREREMQKEQQRQRQRQIERQRQRQEEEQKASEKRRKMERQQKLKQNQNQFAQEKVVSLEHLPSTYSRDQSSNASSKSKKKNAKKKQSVINQKPRTAFLGGSSPLGEESFYEDEYEQEVPKPKQKVPKKILSFSDDENDEILKSKTDTNFYAPSIKPPSSKPPLSRKSSSSKAKSKKKDGVIELKNTSKASQIEKKQKSKEGQKKKTLIEMAMEKNYENSRSNSQCSFDSRESFNSKDSRGSRNSKRSQKKQGVISIKQNTCTNFNRPPIQKIREETLANRTISHEAEMKKIVEEEKRKKAELEQRVIVSKNTFFIDNRGQLVQRDLVIKGNKTYSKPTKEFDESIAYNRLRKSREKRKSRSREKSMQRSEKRLRSKQSQNSGDESSASSYYKNYYQGSQSQTPKNSTFYQTSSYESQMKNQTGNYDTLRQFLKPIQHSYRPNVEVESDNINGQYESSNVSYNQMFGGKGRRKNEMVVSREKRTMKRTERSQNRHK